MNRILVEPDETARRIRAYVREHPDLRKNEYDGRDGTVEGMCYLLAESYYHSTGARDSGLRIYCLSWADVREDGAGTHWYLRDGEDGPWIDLGLEKPWHGTHIPYSAGRHRAFMTGYEPSNRTKSVLEALQIEH
ncbi:hypothetical protein [Halomontanus rarus]|uniref:hypothetical protein n=1 Tax=Halomontanus rarus TaxID=3034020 RepID=UPI00307B183A